MADIQTQDQATILSNEVTAIQAASTTQLDFTVGSVLLAICQAVAGISLWLQGMILQLLTLTRAATSIGTDLDSWAADYGFLRLGGAAATGSVTFSRFSNVGQALVLPGTVVQTGDGSQPFTVTIDTTNSYWNVPKNAYVMANGVSSIAIPVQAQNVGTQGNVLANTITSIAQSLPGVDTVNNASAFINGIDTESDKDFRSRFVLYLNSLSKGTLAAIKSAIKGIQQGLTCTITENADYNATVDNGFFYAVIDDGSGTPSADLLNKATVAVDLVRGATIRYGVFAPIITTVNVSMSIHVSSAYNQSAVVGAVGTAITNALNAMTLQTSLFYTSVAGIAYSVPGVLNVTTVLVNSATSDIVVDQKHVIKAGSVTVNPF